MALPGARMLFEWNEMRRFNQLSMAARKLVFYAEDHNSWPHFSQVVNHLTYELDQDICYVTSSDTDPILKTVNPRIRHFCIGSGTIRTLFFLNLKACIMVMTMPDLDIMYIKRSRAHPVHYVYIFHSIVSTHMIYRPCAFDHYDTLFAVGPHHVREIRATEKTKGLPPRAVFEHGYGRLDSILTENANSALSARIKGRMPSVLVAPSWGPHGLIETHGEVLAEAILQTGCQLTIRPHPMTARNRPRAISTLERFKNQSNFTLEVDISSQKSLLEADIMISDWSGAALEFAFGLERPVLFIDLPRKVNNPDYENIGLQPLEASIRPKIGAIIDPKRLHSIGEDINRLCADPADFRESILQTRDTTVFNIGSSGQAGARKLLDLAHSTVMHDKKETGRSTSGRS